MVAHAVRHEKLDVFGPAVASLGESYFFFAERFTMGCTGVLFVRCAIADMAFDDNEHRCVPAPAKNLNCLSQSLMIVDITYALDVPAIGEEPRRDVIAKS